MRINPCGLNKTAGEDWLVNENSKRVTDEMAQIIQSSRCDCEVRGNKLIAYEFPINDRFIPLSIQVYEREYSPGEFIVNVYFEHNGSKHPVPIVDRITNANQAIKSIQKGFNAIMRGEMPSAD